MNQNPAKMFNIFWSPLYIYKKLILTIGEVGSRLTEVIWEDSSFTLSFFSLSLFLSSSLFRSSFLSSFLCFRSPLSCFLSSLPCFFLSWCYKIFLIITRKLTIFYQYLQLLNFIRQTLLPAFQHTLSRSDFFDFDFLCLWEWWSCKKKMIIIYSILGA